MVKYDVMDYGRNIMACNMMSKATRITAARGLTTYKK